MTVNNNTNYSASDIGATFVETYYGTLAQSPQKLARMYKKDSQITHNSIHVENESTYYQGEQIESALQEFTNTIAKNVKVKLYLVESQSSIKGSLLVNVHGAFMSTSSSEVEFTQTFVLATQKNGYYVLNDILKLENNKSTQLNGIRDSVEVDSTAATMGEGSVHSFSEEEIRSIEAANNGDDKDSTDLKEEQPVKKSFDNQNKKQHNKQQKEDKKTTAATTTTATTTTDKKKHQKKEEVKKTTVATPDQATKKAEEKKSDAPTTYAAIVGGDDYVAAITQQQQQQQQKQKSEKKQKRTAGPKPDKKFTKPASTNENGDAAVEEQSSENKRVNKKKFERKSPATPNSESNNDKKQQDTTTAAAATTTEDDGFEQKKSKKYVKKDKPFKKFNNNNNSTNNNNGEEKEHKPRKVFNDDNKFGVYVARVDPSTTNQQLQEAFSKYGEIVDMNNRSRANEKKPKFKLGYALVFYNNQESMNKVIEEKEITVNGQKVAVSLHSRKNKTN